ncbi:MAG: FAD-dependent oxidoreductase, partial [Pseudomonadota bacterium]
HPGMAAGAAVEQHLLASCRGVSHALRNSARQGAWLSVGPLRPGVRLTQTPGIYRVGNAAGEAHPLVGEGMRMAVESARELTLHLLRYAVRTGGEQRLKAMTVAYSKSWRRLFASRLRIAGCYAQIAMRPMLSQPASTLLERWPGLLTTAAVYAGKARSGVRLFDSREDFE